MLPNTLFDAPPNDGVANAAAVELLPNTGSDFCAAATVDEPNRFVVGVCDAVVTAGAPNATAEPNAGVPFVFDPNAPKTGADAGLLNVVVVDAPNAGGAAVVVVLLRLNEPPKLGTVVVAMLLNDVFDAPKVGIDATAAALVVVGIAVGIPNRFGAAACEVTVDEFVFPFFAPKTGTVVLFVFDAPNRFGVELAGATGAVAVPKENVPPGGAGVVAGAPNVMPDGFAAKLKVGAGIDALDVVVGIIDNGDAVVVVFVGVKLNDCNVVGVPNDGAANDGIAFDGAATAGPFRFLANENEGIDCVLVVATADAVAEVDAITPNVNCGFFGAVVAPKLKPPAAGVDLRDSTAVAAAVEAMVGVEVLPNENVGSAVDADIALALLCVATISFSDLFVASESFKLVSLLAAIAAADGVVNVAAKENPPRRGTYSLAAETVAVELSDGDMAVVVGFNANEIVGFGCSLVAETATIFGNALL